MLNSICSWATVCLICLTMSTWGRAQQPQSTSVATVPATSLSLQWRALPPIPDELGLAGPVVGVHDDILIVGGGANFAKPVWENVKQWHRKLYALDLRRSNSQWCSAGALPSRLAYSACASTPYGVAVLGGNDEQHVSNECWLLQARRGAERIDIDIQSLPALPQALVYAQAAWIRDRLIVISGQTGTELSTAIAGGWQLPIADANSLTRSAWQKLAECPGGPRAFAMLSSLPNENKGQTNKQNDDTHSIVRLLLMGGRRQSGAEVQFLSDVWRYDIANDTWQQQADLPVPVAAGAAAVVDQRYVAIVSGDDGQLFTQADQLKDRHPGFAKRTWLFEPSQNRWHAGGPSPANQVTTLAITVGNRIILASGEVRPRVRTNQVWEVSLQTARP